MGDSVCATLSLMVFHYKACSNDTIIILQRGSITVVSRSALGVPNMIKEMKNVWELLCTTTMWYIWIAGCSKVFDNFVVHPEGNVRNVWMRMVRTLKEQYDGIKGDINVAVLQSLSLIDH